jgi:hypothetical protein
MGWLKSIKIKAATQSAFCDFQEHLAAYATNRPNDDAANVVRYVLSHKYGAPESLIDQALRPGARQLGNVLGMVIWEQVYQRLAHDPTIGEEEDIVMVFVLVQEMLEKAVSLASPKSRDSLKLPKGQLTRSIALPLKVRVFNCTRWEN